MSERKINTEHTQYGWCATLDGYDGAPDAKGIYSLQGHGSTEENAIESLLFRISEIEANFDIEKARVEYRKAT